MAAFLVTMVGMAALVVDVGSILDEKRQLQNGADAGALAAAHSCAAEGCANAALIDTMAGGLANANSHDNASMAVVSYPAAKRVKVDTSTISGGTSILPYSFGQVLTGVKGKTVHASAVAGWDFIGAGTVIPLAISPCDRARLQIGVASVIDFAVGFGFCNGKDGSGLFGWLNLGCQTTMNANTIVNGSSGKAGPRDCLTGLKGTDILLPVFDTVTGTGSNALYHVVGFAALRLTGWSFPGDVSTPPPSPCGGTCIAGTFVNLVSTAPGTGGGGGADFGVSKVFLLS